jgi:uncharacterized protein
MFSTVSVMKTTAIALLLLGFTACATSEPSRFYILNSLADTAQETRAFSGDAHMTIGIGRVEFPAYLDRQQIVTRLSDNELHLAGFDEWAEPLKENFSRVLVENLECLLPSDFFTVFPFRGLETPDWQVEITVIRLDGSLGGQAILLARWSIFDRENKALLLTQKSNLQESTTGPGYEALVTAQSRLLKSLSREIAGTILGLARQKPRP